jgi:hypothetical protein
MRFLLLGISVVTPMLVGTYLTEGKPLTLGQLVAVSMGGVITYTAGFVRGALSTLKESGPK